MSNRRINNRLIEASNNVNGSRILDSGARVDLSKKDGVYITLQNTNTNETTSALIPANINLEVNELIEDISQYDIYVKSLTVSTGNIPYFNVRRNILYPSNVEFEPNLNFELNRTNYTIGILNGGGNYFNFQPITDNYLISCAPVQTGNVCAGATGYLQFISENDQGFGNANPEGTPTDFLSVNFPRSYFDINSIQTFVDMINKALINVWDINTGQGGEVSSTDCPILSFDPVSQLYSFFLTADFINNGYQIYANDFLTRALDGFNWKHLSTTNMNENPYQGLNNKLVTPLRPLFTENINPNDPATPYIGVNLYAEYATITNIVDAHSIVLLTSNGSDLSNIEPQYIPFSNLSNGNLPSTQSLIAFNLDFGGLNSGANNPYIQYNALVLDNKLTCKTKTSLRNLSLSVAIQTIEQELIPINLQANGGLFSCTLVFFRK
jgi:hypothetical protein